MKEGEMNVRKDMGTARQLFQTVTLMKVFMKMGKDMDKVFIGRSIIYNCTSVVIFILKFYVKNSDKFTAFLKFYYKKG